MKYKLLSLGNLLAPILHTAIVALGGAIPASPHHQAQAIHTFTDSSASRLSLADALFIFQISELENPRFGDFRAAI
jgi:hypothetical protein